MQDDYIRIRCSSVQKLSISSRAEELGLSMTDYVLRCITYDLLHPDALGDVVMVPVSRQCLDKILNQ